MLNPGDVLLYKSPGLHFNNLISHGVRFVEGNEVIHVALYLGNNTILEALEGGVKIKVVKDLVNRPNGLVLAYVSRLPNFSTTYARLFSIAVCYNNKPYGYLTDFNIFLQHGKCLLFPGKLWTVWFKSKNGYICSEVTQLVYETLGKSFPKLACLTEPDDYLNFPWIVTKI